MHAQFTAVTFHTSTGRPVRVAAIASNATQGLLPTTMPQTPATDPAAPLRGWRRPSDGTHATPEMRTSRPNPDAEQQPRQTFADRCLAAALASEKWSWRPLDEDDHTLGAVAVDEDGNDLCQVTPISGTCDAAKHSLCEHQIAWRHYFLRPNNLIIGALAQAAAIAKHRQGVDASAAPDSDAAPSLPACQHGHASMTRIGDLTVANDFERAQAWPRTRERLVRSGVIAADTIAADIDDDFGA